MVLVPAQYERLGHQHVHVHQPRQRAGARRHLTLVSAVVAFLHVFNLQRPVVGALAVQHLRNGVRALTESAASDGRHADTHLEPLVVGVHERAGADDVPVPPANPRHLRTARQLCDRMNILYVQKNYSTY